MAYATSETLSSELLDLASSKVDELTFNRINAVGFDNLTEFQQALIKKATLAQTQYYEDYGTEAEALSSISVGSFSMGMNNSSGGYKGVSAATVTYLKQTGLMCRVVR